MSDTQPQTSLDYLVHRADTAGDGSPVVVLLHGRGSHKGDLMGLQPMLPASWTVVTPEAPFPSSAWGYGAGSAWYRYVEDDRVVPETLEQSLTKLDRFLADLPDVLGFQPGRLVLGGFSQGGTTSLAYALSRPASVASVLVFSGFLVADAVLDESGKAPPVTPVFWGHGVADEAIPITIAQKGRERLRRAGARLVAEDYGIGHWIVAEEVADAVAAVERF